MLFSHATDTDTDLDVEANVNQLQGDLVPFLEAHSQAPRAEALTLTPTLGCRPVRRPQTTA